MKFAIVIMVFASSLTVNAAAQVLPSSSYSDEGGTSATMNVGEQRGPKEEEQKDGAATVPSSICRLVENAAISNGLPVEFFARIISQESDFKPDAVGPLTRKGQRAQGIAQFMPETASERLLHDPFDPAQALPKSAELLRDLRAQFGNFGLAAAAYNAGSQRVRNWLSGQQALPSETQGYVRKVTGHPVEEWARLGQQLTVAVSKETVCVESTQVAAQHSASPTTGIKAATGSWVVQLIGDSSDTKAVSRYAQLQKKHEALLGTYQPVTLQTTLRTGAPIWTRIRVNAISREAAEKLCAKLQAVGESCLVQRS
jgi:hypothetical protein